MRIFKMKSFLFKILILIVVILVCDIVIGKTMTFITNNVMVGGQARDNYICNECIDDILIFGSSRAVHHYNAPMLEDSLGMTCYNCGDDGNGIILSYGRLKMIKERHAPKIIIHDVSPDFDFHLNDNHKYLGWLKSRYDKEGIPEIFIDVDRSEQYKMISGMYKYNSKFLQNVFSFLTQKAHDTGKKGFRPIPGEMDKMRIAKVEEGSAITIDSVKLRYVNKFIEEAKGAKLFFIISPVWNGMNSIDVQYIKEICNEKHINLIDYSCNPKYFHADQYFCDGNHLNEYGAAEFTKDLIKEIRLFK